MLEGLHAIRRKNRLPPSKNPENLEESVVLRRRNGAAPNPVSGAIPLMTLKGGSVSAKPTWRGVVGSILR